MVRGDLAPLSTKVSGIVRTVKVSDYQKVHKGDVLVELQDEDYKAEVAQATAAVEAARRPSRTTRSRENFKIRRFSVRLQELIWRRRRS